MKKRHKTGKGAVSGLTVICFTVSECIFYEIQQNPQSNAEQFDYPTCRFSLVGVNSYLSQAAIPRAIQVRLAPESRVWRREIAKRRYCSRSER
jgi:hypothetical protein